VGLEALALVPVGELQDADPALPATYDKQLLPGGHQEHGGPGLVAAESYGEREREKERDVESNKVDESEETE